MTTPEPITDWKIQQLNDLTGKRYLITGGNSGIGYEAAAHLHRANADVFIASRSSAKGTQAVTSLAQIDGRGATEFIQLDLASLDSIRAANEAIRRHTDGLDAVSRSRSASSWPERPPARFSRRRRLDHGSRPQSAGHCRRS